MRHTTPNLPFPCSSESTPSPGVLLNASDVDPGFMAPDDLRYHLASKNTRRQPDPSAAMLTSPEIDEQLQDRRPREQKTPPLYRLQSMVRNTVGDVNHRNCLPTISLMTPLERQGSGNGKIP